MMDLLKKEDREALVVMTCAGELLGGGEATHRLIVNASVR
jgi:sortase (surface protein transpeptidase)